MLRVIQDGLAPTPHRRGVHSYCQFNGISRYLATSEDAKAQAKEDCGNGYGREGSNDSSCSLLSLQIIGNWAPNESHINVQRTIWGFSLPQLWGLPSNGITRKFPQKKHFPLQRIFSAAYSLKNFVILLVKEKINVTYS